MYNYLNVLEMMCLWIGEGYKKEINCFFDYSFFMDCMIFFIMYSECIDYILYICLNIC